MSGIKRHIVADRQGALQMIAENPDILLRVENHLADGGYSGEGFAQDVKAICGADIQAVLIRKF